MDAAGGTRWRGDGRGVGGVLPAVVSLEGTGTKERERGHLVLAKAPSAQECRG